MNISSFGRIATIALVAGLAALANSPAQAAQRYSTILSGANEVPANPSTATGSAKVWIDLSLNTIRIVANFEGLTVADTAAHIHCCALPGANAPVAIDSPVLPGFPLGVTSGAYDTTLDLLDALIYTPAFVTGSGGTAAGARDRLVNAFNDGATYFNIHTSLYPGGEIRGNFTAVPEPGSWAMMIIGFGMAGAAYRKRRPARIAWN